MHDLYVAEIYRPTAMFLPLKVWVYVHSLLHSEPRKNSNSALRSFKVIEIGTNRKPICDFLLCSFVTLVPVF